MHQKETYIIRNNIGDKMYSVLKESKCVLAGGAITSLFSNARIKDYDIYFFNSDADQLMDKIKLAYFINKDVMPVEETIRILFKTDFAVTVSIDKNIFQFIDAKGVISDWDDKKEPVKQLLSRFDFTVCMGAFDFNTDKFIFDDCFFEHLAKRMLVYNVESQYPFSSLWRSIKYVKKGFTINGIEMLKLGLKCHKIPLNNYSELRKQLMGVDVLFLKALMDKLNDPEISSNKYDFNMFLQLMEKHMKEYFGGFSNEDLIEDFGN